MECVSLEGNTLKPCVFVEGGRPAKGKSRPTALESKNRSKVVPLILKRVKD